MTELIGKSVKNLNKLLQKIKNTIFYIGLSMFISSIFYYIALGINNITKYLLKSMGFKPKVITYPRKEKDEDILGI
jgi:membrane protein required for beta-lactamase induction